MIRTTITPVETNIVLQVLQNYIGKKIEVLIFDMDEVEVTKAVTHKPSLLRGGLSKEPAEKMQQHIQQSRDEWLN